MEPLPQGEARSRGRLLLGTPPWLRESGGYIATTSGPCACPIHHGPRVAGEHDRQYINADVCRHYWETRTPFPWSDVHLPNNWHLFADQVPIPLVPMSVRARRDEIERRRRLLPDDLYYDDRYALDSVLWDTWLKDEHDMQRASYFVGTASGPRRPCREVRGCMRVCGLTPTPSPSPSPSPPPPPHMTAEEEARLMQHVMEDSMNTHDEGQWPGLEETMALSTAGDVAIPELEMVKAEEVMEEEPVAAFHPGLVVQQWSWSCTALEMADTMRGANWCPTPPRSPERDASPQEEVVQAPPAFQPGLVYHGPPAHLWTPPNYVDLISNDDDTGGH